MEKDERCPFRFVVLKSSFPTTYSQEDFEYVFHQFASHLPLIEFGF